MRRRVTWLVAATTSAVLLVFLVPLAFFLRTLAEDRAIDAATSGSKTLLAAAAATARSSARVRSSRASGTRKATTTAEVIAATSQVTRLRTWAEPQTPAGAASRTPTPRVLCR